MNGVWSSTSSYCRIVHENNDLWAYAAMLSGKYMSKWTRT